MPPSDPSQRLYPPERGVTVRMYATGFGDCFLLAFPGEDGNPRYVLIDCGVHDRYPKGRERLEAIARDIAEATNRHLHVVAVTHEHSDHLYGFMYGKESFAECEIDELWLAWTEDPDHPVAQELTRLFGKRIQALKVALTRLQAAGNPYAERIALLFGFDLGANTARGMKGNKEILTFLREKSRNPLERPEDYKTPGRGPLEIPGVRGVKGYVLGPPEDVASIKRLDSQKETYLQPLTEETALISAILEAADVPLAGDSQEIQGYPFDATYSVSLEKAVEMDFFREMYGFSDEKGHGPRWRRIESDWLEEGVTQLALRVSGMVNNTSLVLAFALTDATPPKVLLFAGDAQVGNWLSWQKAAWEGMTGRDLIRQTVLYKVGHHGSANATLREKGLEMMESTELVAMLPVHQEWANKQGWHHPDEKVLARLLQRARGRVIRSDTIPDSDSLAPPDESREAEWEPFRKHLAWDKSPDKRWIQYTIEV